jgi:hypothetical protein
MDFLVDVKALNNTMKLATFEAKEGFPNQLLCKKESTNELLVLSMENSNIKSETGLCLTSIDLSCLTRNPEEDKRVYSSHLTIPVNFLNDSQSGGEESKRGQRSKGDKLVQKDIPHKILLNRKENIIIVISTYWIGVISLVDTWLVHAPDFEWELELVGWRNGIRDIDKTEWILDVKYHPLSPYTICTLNDKNVFKMYDISYSIDIPFKELMLKATDLDTEAYSKNWSLPFSAGNKLIWFEFGSQWVLGWQKITCYFLAQNGQVYHLTPLIPLKFGIENVFFDKLTEKDIIRNSIVDFLTLLATKKRIIQNEITSWLVSLTESEHEEFTPVLQGPILNSKLEKFNNFVGMLKFDTYPQAFASYNIKGDIFIQVTFEEPEPIFEGEKALKKHSWITKDCLEIGNDDGFDDLPLVIPDIHNLYSFYVLRNRCYWKVELHWLRDIHKQMKFNNYIANDFVYNESKNSELKILMEFINKDHSVVGINVFQNVLFILRNFKERKILDLKLIKLNEQDYTEIQRYVEEMLLKRPQVDQFVAKSVVKKKLEEKYKDFKLPQFKLFKLSGKEGKMNERDFLKEFWGQAEEFSENVTSELELFRTDVQRRVILLKELEKEQKQKEQELGSYLDLIQEKNQFFESNIKKILWNNSEIKKKIESITRKLRDNVTAPLSKREECMFLKIREVSDKANYTLKTIKNQIELFREEREKEDANMKDYKVKFSKDTIDKQIKPKIKKLKEIRQNLIDFRNKIEMHKEERFEYDN